jgi:hypothetical protein
MLSMLLSMEELELLPIAMCLRIIFTSFPLLLSCPSTSYYHQAMVPIISSSPTSTLSLSLPHLPQFFYFQNRTCTKTPPPSWISWNYVSNEPSYARNGFRTRELCQFYSGDAICPRLISDCATLNISAISPCTSLQNWYSWCVGNKIWRSFWMLTFLPLYISEYVLKSWWKQQLHSQAL